MGNAPERKNPASIMSDRVMVRNVPEDENYKRIFTPTDTKQQTVAEFEEAKQLEQVRKEDTKSQFDSKGYWITGQSIEGIEIQAKLHNQRINELRAMRASRLKPCKFNCGENIVTYVQGDNDYAKVGPMQANLDVETGAVSFHDCSSNDIESLRNQIKELRRWMLDLMLSVKPFIR
jgi:hypothetical protein